MGRNKQQYCKNGHERTPENIGKSRGCKLCAIERQIIRRKNNPMEQIEGNATYYALHTLEENARSSAYFKNNPDKACYYTRKYQVAKLQATAAWADDTKILSFYTEAQRLTKETGIPHSVDHIIPLKNPNVCGLHVEHNLQVITKSENSIKHNTFVPGFQNFGLT